MIEAKQIEAIDCELFEILDEDKRIENNKNNNLKNFGRENLSSCSTPSIKFKSHIECKYRSRASRGGSEMHS